MMKSLSVEEEDAISLEQLVGTLETIDIDRLKRISYRKYVNQLFDISKRSIEVDGVRLTLIIQHLKSFQGACFQRDVVIDILDRILSECLLSILTKPFKGTSEDQWSELACSLASVPDVLANCKATGKLPHLEKEPYHNRLIEQIYVAIELKSESEKFTSQAYKLFLLKLLGRIVLNGFSHSVWDKFTRRALYESRPQVRNLCRDILVLAVKPPNAFTTLELFVDYLILPIFSSHKPRQNSAELINSLLTNCVIDSERMRYLICDKSIFQTNYDLTRDKQAIVLFNIASYLSSLVISGEDKSKDSTDGVGDSLLVKTLLDIVRTWTNPTKILIRTYAHSKYITCALLVFYRYASEYDSRCLTSYALKIQSMIINSIPIYLNRAAQEQRNLACCLCGLVLPKLRDEIVKGRHGSVESGDFELNFKVDLNDDLRYLRQLLIDDIGVIFRHIPDDCPSTAVEADSGDIIATVSTAASHERRPCQRRGQRQLGDKRQPNEGSVIDDSDKIVTSHSGGSALIGDRCMSDNPRAYCNEQDLVPYDISDSDDSDGDDDFEPGNDATNVPIYLSDCITGLIENNNHRYVRLCLIKASALIDSLIDGEDADAAAGSEAVCLAGYPTGTKPYDTGVLTRDDCEGRSALTSGDGVNDTLRDLGIELARTLLFLDNQYNIDKFDEYRTKCLTSLCFAAPDLVGKYLIDELNGTNRSMRQQMDILSILVTAAERLSSSSGLCGSKSIQVKQMKLVRVSRRGINKFAPYASLFFYGISHRLKADVSCSRALITTRPQSIISSFRERISEIDGSTRLIVKNIKSGDLNTNTKLGRKVLYLDDHDEDIDENKHLSKNPKQDVKDIDAYLEQNSISDDSYLLSRILLSISNILSYSAQQPVTCKLSSDLLDILSAYRCHPDSGVQRAIVSCLKIIRDCTPSTYYSSYIEKRMLRSFGPWLAKIEPNVQ